MDNGSSRNLGPIWGVHEKHRCIVSEIPYHIELHLKDFHKFREHVSLFFSIRRVLLPGLDAASRRLRRSYCQLRFNDTPL